MPDALAFALTFILGIWACVAMYNAITGTNGFVAWQRLLSIVWAVVLFAGAYTLYTTI